MSDDEGRYAEYHIGWQEGYAEAKSEAADEITRLRAENEKLREALRPFVKTLAWNCTDADPDDACIDHEGALSVGDLRAAAAALKETGE